MYISPVVYPLSVIPEEYRYLASFNPMVGIIETGRELFFGFSSFNIIYVTNGLITTFVMVFLHYVDMPEEERKWPQVRILATITTTFILILRAYISV